MVFILGHIIQIDENVVKIDYYADIKEIWENIVHEPLKSYRRISQTERYGHLFERLIVSTEGCLLFIFFCNLY